MSQNCFILQGRKNNRMPLHCLNCGSRSIEKSQKFWFKSLSVSSVAILGHFDSHIEPWKKNCLKRNLYGIVAKLILQYPWQSFYEHLITQCKRHSIPSLVCFQNSSPASYCKAVTIIHNQTIHTIDLHCVVSLPTYYPQHSFIHD